MDGLEFTWSDLKAQQNFKKHGVSFEEAATAFLDPNARIIFDAEHSETEDRFILLGTTTSLKTVVVCHCYREGGVIVRIISARKANKSEQQTYYS
ncbi:MAG: BrnT family toxin [Cyanobacteria bacterium J06635_1]